MSEIDNKTVIEVRVEAEINFRQKVDMVHAMGVIGERQYIAELASLRLSGYLDWEVPAYLLSEYAELGIDLDGVAGGSTPDVYQSVEVPDWDEANFEELCAAVPWLARAHGLDGDAPSEEDLARIPVEGVDVPLFDAQETR